MTADVQDVDAPRYPRGTVETLLDTDLVTPKTREVLESRLAAHASPTPEARFFNRAELETLRAACARLIPQPDRERPIDIAGAIDQRLAEGKTDGWRYDDMPPDGDAYRLALRGLDETASVMFGAGDETVFGALDGPQQDTVLAAVQSGSALGKIWVAMPPSRFFEEVLAEAVEIYYSHPLAQDEIGFAGFADAHGWQRIGLDHIAPFEPRALDARSNPDSPEPYA